MCETTDHFQGLITLNATKNIDEAPTINNNKKTAA
jgi:hypothetical protein